jgi:hypothetical protein
VSFKASFRFNDASLNSNIIGFQAEQLKFKEAFEHKTYERFEIDTKTLDMCLLTNNTLLVLEEDCMKVYDKDLKQIKILPNSKHFDKAITNNADRIYLYCRGADTIEIRDLDLTFVNCYTDNEMLIEDLEYHNDCLYVCGKYEQIHKFTPNLVFIEAVKFNQNPFQIKILNNIACVLSSGHAHFYDIETSSFKPIYTYRSKSGKEFGEIITYNNNFYITERFNEMNQNIYSFRDNFKVCEIFRLENAIPFGVSKLFEFNGRLLSKFCFPNLNALNDDTDDDSTDAETEPDYMSDESEMDIMDMIHGF